MIQTQRRETTLYEQAKAESGETRVVMIIADGIRKSVVEMQIRRPLEQLPKNLSDRQD